VSGPLRTAIQAQGGRIMRYEGRGLFRDVTDGNQSTDLYRRGPGGFQRVSLQPKSITEEPQPTTGGGPAGGDAAGGRATPEEEPPVTPPETETPELEVPEIP
jgi:hypothetical protein